MNEQPAPAKPESCDVLTVMFDGTCPLCRREIGIYQSLTPQEPVAWLDVSQPSADMTPADQASYLARFHVRQKDGKVLSGAAAFVALWLTMPGWRWLGRFGRLPGVTPVLEVFYRGFLHLRPYLQRMANAANAAERAHLPDDAVADLRASTVFSTAAAVQTFADSHCQTQIDKLSNRLEDASKRSASAVPKGRQP